MTVAACALATSARAEVGWVRASVGPANILRARAVAPARAGAALQEGDILVTGKDGRISIVLVDKTRLAVAPGSRLTITRLAFDAGTRSGAAELGVNRGTVAVVSGEIAKANRDGFRVRTPTSLLAARGTSFVVEVP